MKHLLPAVQRTALRIPWAAVGGCAAALLLTAAAPGGQYAPWALAAVAAAGVGWQGLLAVVCAGLGALLFMDFQPGLRHTAAALLIFCANTALCNTRLYRRPRFRPMAAVCAAGLTQLPYLIQRGGRQWALCMAALALLYGAAALLPDLLPESAAEQADKRRAWFLLLLGVCAVPAGWTVMGFSPAVVLAGILLLYFVGRGPVPDAAAAGALAGLVLDLCGTGELYLAVVLCAAASAAAGLRRGQRVPAAAAFCAAGVLAALLLGEVRPLAVLCQLLTAAGVWLLLPEKEGMLLTAAGEVSPEAAAPAAAFRAVYDSLEDHAPLLRPENPAVLFDRAAEQVCRDCSLRSDCWQTHYTDTYNAFNDACPALLRRGQALAEDFPPYFADRCVRFPKLLTALDGQLHDFLQRRLHHGRLDAAYRLAREQYRQVAEVLSRTAPAERLRRAHLTCRTAALLRPKTGEKHCGDQCAVFDAGGLVCLALSDGMGSGESAHCEAAMTIRLLRQFLQAGIEPLPALKTLNTAAMLRCQGGRRLHHHRPGLSGSGRGRADAVQVRRRAVLYQAAGRRGPLSRTGAARGTGERRRRRAATARGGVAGHLAGAGVRRCGRRGRRVAPGPAGRMGRHLAPGAGGGTSPSVRSADGRRGRLRRAGAGHRRKGGPAPRLSDKKRREILPAAPYNFPPPRRYYGCNKQRPSRLKEASVLVKGVSRRVIVVDSPDPRIFEQAIFILPTDGGGVSSRQLVDEAVRIARSYARGQTGARRRWRPPAWLWAVWGACACGLVWLLAALL